MKTSGIYLLVSLVCIGSLHAEWMDFNAGSINHLAPIEGFNSSWDDYLTFDVELRGLEADTITEGFQNYLRFSNTPGIVLADSIGYPELPIVRCFVWVPDSTHLSFSYSANCADVISCLPVYPAPLDSLVDDYFIKDFFEKDSIAFLSSSWYPENLVEYVDELRFRDARLAIYDVYPVQYLADGDSLRVWSDIQVTVNFDDTTSTWPTIDFGHFEKMVGDRIIGYTPSDDPWAPVPGLVMRPTNLSTGPARVPDYVILTAAGLDGAWVDTLARHRADLCGFDVAIVRTDSVFSQFGSRIPITRTDIRDFTEAMWNWGQPSSSKRPSYLLLIGDSEDASYGSSDWYLPSYSYECSIWTGENSICDDDWYVYFDEPYSTQRSIPDMMVGRIPVRTTQELQDFIDVIRDYEAESTIPVPDSLSWRRHLSYFKGEVGSGWKPDSAYVDSVRQWCGYSWDYFYGGDFDTSTSSDGSTMSSLQWDSLLDSSLSRGQQLVIYTNHGIPHAFSAGMDWRPHQPFKFQGIPDSTFDCFDVDTLSEDAFTPHGYPFIINACCATGRISHTNAEHIDTGSRFYYCFNEDSTLGPVFDYGIDCIGEKFLKHPNAGAIGFFAGSAATYINHYNGLAQGLMESILYYGNTRMGDAIVGMRFKHLGQRFMEDIALYNLLGDPAVDLGDRVKFRNCCDLIVSPPDLGFLRYPSRPLGGSSSTNLEIIVRNAGAVASGAFDAELEIEIDDLHYDTTLTESSLSIAAGTESILYFDGWRVPPGITSDMEMVVTCEVDPDADCNDSWTANNIATREIPLLDFYPYESGWPVRVPGSVKSPPVLADLNNDGDLEIVFVLGDARVCVIDPSYPDSLLWESQAYVINPASLGGFSIPTVADVTGDGDPEIIIDTYDRLVVLDGSDGDLICSYSHDGLSGLWQYFPHTVVVSDIFKETGGLLPRDEIAFVASDLLYILRYESGNLSKMDSVVIITSEDDTFQSDWLCAAELDGNPGNEIVFSGTVKTETDGISYRSVMGLYSSSNTGSFYEERTWRLLSLRSIPAIGDLGSGDVIAMSKGNLNSIARTPVDLLDPSDLSTAASCTTASVASCNDILCCLMADWDIVSGFDRVIAPAENQCFVFVENGDEDWNAEYEDPSYPRPPFPALGDLNADDIADILVGTRDGYVNAYDYLGNELEALGFPYTLPSEICGGFVIADIDNDEKVEVVFGTMDNYLHVWELGSCDEGYAPWPQIQHDAERTGALE